MASGGRNAGFYVAVAACAAMLLGAAPAAAQDLHVNVADDNGDTMCDETCTLRDAAGEAGPGDTIVIDAGIDPVLAWSGGGTIVLAEDEVIVRGRGALRTVIGTDATAAQPFRVFEVTGSNVTIEDVKITGGVAPHDQKPADTRSGGAIRSTGGTLTLRRVWIDGNFAGEGDVGGGGAPGGGGGGVFSTAPLLVDGSTISGNSAGAGFADVGGDGGGILAEGGLTVTNSTITANAAGSGTIAGNGGGIAVGGAAATVVSATLAGNSSGGPFGPGQGRAIFATAASVLSIRNSILASAPTAAGNCGGAASLIDGGGNIAFGAGGCPAGFGTGDPLLDPDGVVFNGGPTPTLALLPGSAAVDAAVPLGGACLAADGASPLTADQRGLPRPSGHGCDAGAFELQVPPGPPPGGGPAGQSPPPASPGGAAGAKRRAKKKKKKKCSGSFKPKKRKGKPRLHCVKVGRS